MIESKEITAVGKFQKTHALKGELNAILEVDPEFFEDGNPVVIDIDGIYVPFFCDSIRPKGSTSFLLKLSGVDSEEEARKLVNKTVYAEKSKLASFLELEESELLDGDDLEGYTVIDDETGLQLGSIERIDSSTANMLFILKTDEGKEIFIPAVDEFISDIDDENKTIHMTLPHGLIELN